MKKVIILHGTGSNPDSFWFPYLEEKLDQTYYRVSIPNLPNSHEPKLDECLDFMFSHFSFDENTILVGHSSGCPLILSILERIEKNIDSCFLVAGFVHPLGKGQNPILQESYDWSCIKKNCWSFTFVHSLNDPWWCNEKEGAFLFEKLWGKLILLEKEWHMWSITFNQPYSEFPLLLRLIELA